MRDSIEMQRERAKLPDGYVPEGSAGDLLAWSFAEQRLQAALVYWIATVRADGRPHVTPVWGVWHASALYFDGSPESRRVRNMAQNPSVAVHVESGGAGKEVVICEGTARELKPPSRSLTEQLATAYSVKYSAESYAPTPEMWDDGGLYIMQPTLVLAWTEMPRATRWRFVRRDAQAGG